MRFLARLAYLFVRLLNATYRVKQYGAEHLDSTPQYILAFWHAHMLGVVGHAHWKPPITVMVSRSSDGNLSAATLGLFGVTAARGSSSRGGQAALREMIRQARAGSSIVFTPDGPRGPARIAKEGVVYAAQATGLPIIPIGFACRRKRHLGSWDRLIVPMPLTRGTLVYGEPMRVSRDADVEEWRARVEKTLNDLAEEAERRTT